MDMLIKLYEPPASGPPAPPGSPTLRKPLAPEHGVVLAWIGRQFTPGWASEAQAALANRPVTLFIAARGDAPELLGFSCYDATARGMVGPIGVAESARGQGIGAALLRACLADMHAAGYRYAVAGMVGSPEFFRRVAGAVEIPGSTPGLYRGLLRHAPPA